MKIILDTLTKINTDTFLLQIHYDEFEITNIFDTKYVSFIIIKQRMHNNLIEYLISQGCKLINYYLELHITNLINNSFVEISQDKKSYKLTSKALITLL